jgi:hypothetical protein
MAVNYRIRDIAPPDLYQYPDTVRKLFWGWVVIHGLRRKGQEILQGLDKDGDPMKLTDRTIKYRRSAMTTSGKGDPKAPALAPAWQKSRTYSLLAGRAHTDNAEFYWRYDPWTGAEWGKILKYLAENGKDTIGLSPEGTAWVKGQAWRAWATWKKGHPRAVQFPATAEVAVVKQRKAKQYAAAGGRTWVPSAERDIVAGGTESGTATSREPPRPGGRTIEQTERYFRGSSLAEPPGRPQRPSAKSPISGPNYNRVVRFTWGQGPGRSGAQGLPARQQPPRPPTPPPPTPGRVFAAHTFGESQAPVSFGGYRPTGRIETVFGNDVPDKVLASIAGAPDDATVDVQHLSNGAIQITVNHPQIERMVRTVRREGGKIIVHNDIFKVKKEFRQSAGKVGLKAFARQVENANLQGVSRIETYAFRAENDIDPETGKEKWSGYYVWPRYGYDGVLSARTRMYLQRASTPESIKQATQVSELMQTQEGRDWWKEHGEAIDVVFDLKKTGYSMRTLNSYLGEALPKNQ